MWLSLKKFNQSSLDKIKRNSPRLTKRKRFRGQKADKEVEERFSFRDSHRLTASHPELSYSNLAALSNYQSLTSFDDINLITVHHNSENYISDNIEFHGKAKCCAIAKCQNGSICGNEASTSAGTSAVAVTSTVASTSADSKGETSGPSGQRPKLERTTSTFKSSPSLDKPAGGSHEKASKPQLSLSGTSSPTSFFSRFRSASPHRVNSISESVRETDEERTSTSNYRPLPPLNSIATTSCSTFLPKRPHSSLNYSDTTSDARRVQYKQTEAFSASEEDLLLDSEPTAASANATPSKRRDSFLLKLLKKRKSSERNPLDRVGSATNYEYYNQSLDEDYENSISQNVSVLVVVLLSVVLILKFEMHLRGISHFIVCNSRQGDGD